MQSSPDSAVGVGLLRTKEQEVEKMSQEMGVTSTNLIEAMAWISQLGGERDSLAEH